jgi:hypothetical protein
LEATPHIYEKGETTEKLVGDARWMEAKRKAPFKDQEQRDKRLGLDSVDPRAEAVSAS